MLTHLKSSKKVDLRVNETESGGCCELAMTPLLSPPARESSLSGKSTLLLAPQSTPPPTPLFPSNSRVATSWGGGGAYGWGNGGHTAEGDGRYRWRVYIREGVLANTLTTAWVHLTHEKVDKQVKQSKQGSNCFLSPIISLLVYPFIAWHSHKTLPAEYYYDDREGGWK